MIAPERSQRSGSLFMPAADSPRAHQGRSHLRAILRDIADALGGRQHGRATSFRRRVERQVEEMLPAGDANMVAVAKALGCTRQTLYRRLGAEVVTFEDVLEAVRHRLALRFLRKDGLSVKETAYRLGYAEPSGFSRAFKRWTGNSPGMRRGEAAPRLLRFEEGRD
jgi:AraC-like DNA-binding protein